MFPGRWWIVALALLAAIAGYRTLVASPGGNRVLFVGIDGASWKVIGPGIESGELPAFRQLLERGAVNRSFGVVSPHSPVAWTSLATSRSKRDHMIISYTTKLPNGDRIPVSSTQRASFAIWEIVNRYNLTGGVIGWWASWPAEPIDGYVVSNHANPALTEQLTKDPKYWTADPQVLRSLRRDFHPVELATELKNNWISRDPFPFGELQRRAQLTPVQLELLRAAPWNQRTVYSVIKTGYRIDAPLVAITRQLMRDRPTDLTMVYLKGPDPVQHYAWDLVEPERYPEQRPHSERDRGLVKSVYRYVDSLLGELISDLPADTTLIVASDHGAEPSLKSRPGKHGPNATGVLFILGPAAVAGKQLDSSNGYDVMPTILWLLGVPLASDLEGRVLSEAFDDDFIARTPVLRVETYGRRPTGEPLASPADETMLESLRALGYIE